MNFWWVIWACICQGAAMGALGHKASPLQVFVYAMSMFLTGAVIYALASLALGVE